MGAAEPAAAPASCVADLTPSAGAVSRGPGALGAAAAAAEPAEAARANSSTVAGGCVGAANGGSDAAALGASAGTGGVAGSARPGAPLEAALSAAAEGVTGNARVGARLCAAFPRTCMPPVLQHRALQQHYLHRGQEQRGLPGSLHLLRYVATKSEELSCGDKIEWKRRAHEGTRLGRHCARACCRAIGNCGRLRARRWLVQAQRGPLLCAPGLAGPLSSLHHPRRSHLPVHQVMY